MSKSEEKPVNKSRRNFIIAAGGAVAVIAIGGGYYYLTGQAPPSATQTAAQTTAVNANVKLRYLGYPFHLPQDALKKWKDLTGQDIEATYAEPFVIAQKQMENPAAWDFGGSLQFRPLVTAGILQKIPVAKVPRWQADKLMTAFVHPEKYFSAAQAERFNFVLWADKGQSRTDLICVPCMWNFDSVTYLPEFLPYEERGGDHTTLSFSDLFNPEWKGKVGMMDDGYASFTEVANFLNATGQLDISGAISSMTEDEVDRVYDYLLPIIKTGQVRTFWGNYGDIVNLLSTKEIYMAATFQSVCFDARKAGTPAYYAKLVNGPVFWFNAHYISYNAHPDAVPDCLKVINWTQEQWMQLLYTRQGYPSPGVGWDDYKSAMGTEFYDWFFNGKATYLSIGDVMKDTWKDKPEFWNLPERMQNALFLPDVYFRHFWTGEEPRTGSPDPNGNLRDLGSTEDKAKITRYFTAPDLPDNNNYYVSKYEQLKAQIPT
jgi:spermidine/putrescine-binding protein